MDTVISNSPTPDLAISITGPPTAIIGVPFDYGLTLSNVGTGASIGTISVTDALPNGVTLNGVTPGTNFSCSTLAQIVTCTSSVALPSGVVAAPVATIHVTPTQQGILSNSASVSGGGDNSAGDHRAPATNTTVFASAALLPDLTPTLSGPSAAMIGSPFQYTLSLANVGGDPTSGLIVVTDHLTASLNIESVTAGPGFSCDVSSQTVNCTSTNVIVGNTAYALVAIISVTPTQSGPISNQATVSGGSDTNSLNDISPPVLVIVSGNGPSPPPVAAIPAVTTSALMLLAMILGALGLVSARAAGTRSTRKGPFRPVDRTR